MSRYYDPPSGWRYGFPKEYKPLVGETLEQTLLRDGYPQREIDNSGAKHVRFWGETQPPAPETSEAAREIQMTCPRCKGTKTIRPWKETETCGMCGGRGFILQLFPSINLKTLNDVVWEEHINSGDEVIECLERIEPQFNRPAMEPGPRTVEEPAELKRIIRGLLSAGHFWSEGDNGRLFCNGCASERGTPHSGTCPYAAALEASKP